MFDYTVVHWMTFLSAAVLLNISPGPDIAFILGQTLRNGRRQGFAAMFGIWTGAGLHVVMAAIGLSAILATSALAFSIVKWLGAAYLIWLGVNMLLSRGDSFVSSRQSSNLNGYSIYWQGVLVSALNPKVAIFFLAFLPQFAALIEPPLVIAGSRLGAFLRENRRVGLWMDRGLGALFVALGVRLAASSN